MSFQSVWQTVVDVASGLFASISESFTALPAVDRFQVAEATAVVLATLVAWRQISLLRRQLASEHRRTSCGRSLEFSLVRTPLRHEARQAIDRIFPPIKWCGGVVPAAELDRVLEQSPEIGAQLACLFGHWENLALTLAAEIADEDLAYEMVAGAVVQYVDRFREHLRREQEINPRMYAYLLPLAERWRGRLKRRGQRNLYSLR